MRRVSLSSDELRPAAIELTAATQVPFSSRRQAVIGDPSRDGAEVRGGSWVAVTGWTVAFMAVWAISMELPRSLPGENLMDFGSFVASGRAAREGMNPYGIYPLTFHVSFPGFEAWNPNLNPPISALLFQAFDWAQPHVSLRVWWGVSVACYVLTVGLLVWRFRAQQPVAIAIWAFGLAGFWDTLVLGQIYLPLVLAGVAAWLLIERGSAVWAGVLIGVVVALKPNFLVWPALLFLSGHRRAPLVSGVVAGLVSAIPLLVYGPEVYRQWLELVASDRDRATFLTNASLTGLFARLDLRSLGVATSVGLLGAAAIWAWWRRPEAMRASAVGILVGLLASPLAWIHYTLFLLPVLASRWHRLSLRLVAALLLVPVPFIIDRFGAPASVQATTGSLYNWALILCLTIILAEEMKVPSRTPKPLPQPG
jgi:hypothetical protein